jgi:hypothetical protein
MTGQTMDDGDRRLLIESLRSMFTTPGTDPAAALDELGWAEVQQADPAGATTLLFTEHGRNLAGSALLDRTVLAQIAPGEDGAVVYPPFGTDRVTDQGVALVDPSTVSSVWVPLSTGLARMSTAGLCARPVVGFDTGRPWWRVRLASGTAAEPLPKDTWERAEAAGRRALAAELNGITGVLLDIAVRHTGERVQYGRPLSAHQTVRHRLAEAHAALEASRSLLDSAWVEGSAWAAATAKCQAGSAYREVARHAMQLCGAIGLTREHRLHRYVERGALLDELLGSARHLEQELGRRLLDGLRPPTVVDL